MPEARPTSDEIGQRRVSASRTARPATLKSCITMDKMMVETSYTIKPIGVIRSDLVRREASPHQGFEGAPDAWLEMNPTVVEGLQGIAAGDEVVLITWFHQADRERLKVHPRRDPNRPLTGVFATRSPDRPNPIGLHRVTVLEIAGNRLKVRPLEAIDGTPIVDIKPVLPPSADS